MPADVVCSVVGLEGTGPAAGEHGELALMLPGNASGPVPSPGAMVGPATRPTRAVPQLRPWLVPVVRLPARKAVDVLLGGWPGPDRTEDDPAVIVGGAWDWLAAVADTALELVAHGRALPGIVPSDEGRAEARWMPVPTAPDDARILALVGGIPPLCRAETNPAGNEPPEVLLTGALGAMVDAIVRSALADCRLVPARRGRAPRELPAPEAFLAALTDADATIAADPAEIVKLRLVLDDWRRSGLPAAGPLRTCFRLIPPPDAVGEDAIEDSSAPASADPWRVEFLLQSTADPSLLVPAEDVWRAGPALRSLRHTVERPQEHLLTDLGRATRLWPRLEASLQVARPAEMELDGAGAQEFLGQAAPLLEQTGFGVLVPPWWRSSGSRLGVRLRAKPRSAKGFESSPYGLGLAGVCDYRYEVAVGDTTLTAKELRQLAKLKTPLVRVRGQWVELRPGDIERALAVLKRPAAGTREDGTPDAGTMTAGEVLRIGLGLEPAPVAGLPVVGVAADGWLGDLLSGDGEQKLVARPTPTGFDGSLRPYQERGLAWLSFLGSLGLGACLADDMGLGKTAQLLALLLAEREAPPSRKGSPRRKPAPTLLVCPMSLVGNWQREAARFAPGLAVHVHHGAAREVGSAFTKAARRADLVITTYALLARDRDLLAKVRWGRLALDEAQNVKNPSSQAARAARSVPAGTRVALTGTPVENRLVELWSLMDFLNPGLLGSEAAFRQRFAIPVERYRDEEAAGTLKRLTGPFVLRRLKTDRSIIADLPDKVEMNVLCNLTREQASLYQAVVDEMLAKIDEATTGIERMGIISGSMMKLKQVCNHPAHFLRDGSRLGGARSGKLARLEETLEEITASGERALCFTQFAEMGSLLAGHLRGRLGPDVPFLHGGVPKRARDQMVADFQAEGGPPLLLLSLKAGGVGLNLTAANHVIHFDRWWNPAVEDQATDRAFRIGQRRDVQVRKFVCVGTLEERIERMIEDKRELAQRIVGTGEAWINDLSVAQLRDLVALSDDAVAEA